MSTATMPMPGALRWRPLHPLIDDGGACSLIYDLERAAVLEVPEELQLHVAPALETGDPDDDLLSWLVQEDLITMEGWCLDGQPSGGAAHRNLEKAYGMDGETHVRIEGLSEEAAHCALDVAFRQTFGACRVQLHLDWDGKFPGACLLERIVLDASRLAAESGQEVSFDLALAADRVTPAVSLFLSALPLHVRLRCGQSDLCKESAEIERALRLLWMEDLADRVTLCFALDAGSRLKDLLGWARRVCVRHLDVVPPPLHYGAGLETWLRDYQMDLHAEIEETVRELAAGEVPLDFRPITRVIRRLMQSEPLASLGDESLGGWSTVDGAFQSEADSGSCCATCWARYLCRNSASLVAEEVAEARSAESCSVWAAECEAAARLYHKLGQADPLQVLRAFGASTGLPDELPSAPVPELWGPQAPC